MGQHDERPFSGHVIRDLSAVDLQELGHVRLQVESL
jgi:hypothetical protein